jgi:tetratricopeptide (TPR) repeat protein
MTNSDETRAAVMPLVVRTNGKFETDGKPLTEFLQAQCELYEHILEMPIHEIAESVVAEDMKLYHPYARWFNEGVATWVMLTVVSEMAPDWANECRKSQLPARNEPLRAQVNLRAWLQDAYQKKDQSEQEADLSRECYRFATEAIERMLSGQPKDALARVLQKLKDKPFADTGTICAAISDVTGKDPSRILLDYAPNRARAISRKEDIGKLIGQAAQKAKEGSYSEAVELLSRLMEIAPQRNLELNLAWAMRKAGLPKSESEWHIRVAAAPQGSGDFQLMLMVHDAESQYVAGRFAQFCSTAEQAKDLFESALKLDPRHADAKAALKELGSIK